MPADNDFFYLGLLIKFQFFVDFWNNSSEHCLKDFPADLVLPSLFETAATLIIELKPGKNNNNIQESVAEHVALILKFLDSREQFEILENILNHLHNTLEVFTNDTDLIQFTSIAKLIAMASESCKLGSQFLLMKIVPKCLHFLREPNLQTTTIFDILNILVMPCSVFRINCKDVIGSTWKQIVKLLLNSCESSCRDISKAAFGVCSNISSLFSLKHKHLLYQKLWNRLRHEEDTDIWSTCADCLFLIAKSHPRDVKKLVDPEFTNPINPAEITFDDEFEKRLFQTWCALAPAPDFATYLVAAVRRHIEYSPIHFLHHMIVLLKDLCVKEKDNFHFLKILHDDVGLTYYLLDWWHSKNTALPDNSTIFDDAEVAKNMRYIITIIVRALNQTMQMQLAKHYLSLMSVYFEQFMDSFCNTNPENENEFSDLRCSLYIIMYEAILNAIHPSVLTEVIDATIADLVKNLSTISVFCTQPICCKSACRSLATVMNKFLHDNSLQLQVEFMFEFFRFIFRKNVTHLTENTVNLLFHVTKSLAYIDHRATNRCFDLIFSVISNRDIHNCLIEGFYILSHDKDDYFFDVLNHFRVVPGFHDRIFSNNAPRLLAFFNCDDEFIQRLCAFSVVYLIDEMPIEIFQNHMKQIMLLFLNVMGKDEPTDIIQATLEKLSGMIYKNPEIFEKYVGSFIEKLLRLVGRGQFMVIRILALQCLHNFTRLKSQIILPYKIPVTEELASCLDDRKRFVRQEAVRTRLVWYSMDAP